MSTTRVRVLREVSSKLEDGDSLCLQQVFYDYSGNNEGDLAFRFIRKGPTGNLKAQRGQAAIPNLTLAARLIEELEKKMIKTME